MSNYLDSFLKLMYSSKWRNWTEHCESYIKAKPFLIILIKLSRIAMAICKETVFLSMILISWVVLVEEVLRLYLCLFRVALYLEPLTLKVMWYRDRLKHCQSLNALIKKLFLFVYHYKIGNVRYFYTIVNI